MLLKVYLFLTEWKSYREERQLHPLIYFPYGQSSASLFCISYAGSRPKPSSAALACHKQGAATDQWETEQLRYGPLHCGILDIGGGGGWGLIS